MASLNLLLLVTVGSYRRPFRCQGIAIVDLVEPLFERTKLSAGLDEKATKEDVLSGVSLSGV